MKLSRIKYRIGEKGEAVIYHKKKEAIVQYNIDGTLETKKYSTIEIDLKVNKSNPILTWGGTKKAPKGSIIYYDMR